MKSAKKNVLRIELKIYVIKFISRFLSFFSSWDETKKHFAKDIGRMLDFYFYKHKLWIITAQRLNCAKHKFYFKLTSHVNWILNIDLILKQREKRVGFHFLEFLAENQRIVSKKVRSKIQKVMDANFKFKFKNFHCTGVFREGFFLLWNIRPCLNKMRFWTGSRTDLVC